MHRVLPEVRHRQWVLSVPFWLRWRMAFDHDLTRAVLRVFLRAVFALYRERAGLPGARAGAVTVIQRFGSALNLNVHFHTLVPDGVWVEAEPGELVFRPVRGPTDEDLERLADLVPRPNANQILYHGVLAASAEWRPRIVPEPSERERTCDDDERSSPCSSERANHTWSELMCRGLDIDSLECPSAAAAASASSPPSSSPRSSPASCAT